MFKTNNTWRELEVKRLQGNPLVRKSSQFSICSFMVGILMFVLCCAIVAFSYYQYCHLVHLFLFNISDYAILIPTAVVDYVMFATPS